MEAAPDAGVSRACLGWLLVGASALVAACATAALAAPAVLNEAKLVDLTYTFDDKTIYWPTEDGFHLEVAHRDQLAAADGMGTLIRFRTATHKFGHRAWTELETTTIAHEVLVPSEFSGGLPTDQLVDAWLDYKQAVNTVNRERWAKESASREEQRAAREAREQAMRDQLGAADLLDEDEP